MLNKLLEFIGKTEIGDKKVEPDIILPGLLIADATRQNGNKCQIGVKYIDSIGKYAAVCDPEGHKGMIASIDALYVYSEAKTEPEKETVELSEYDSMTIPEITSQLVLLGVPESDVKKLGNKQAKFDKMKEMQKDLEDKE